MEGQTADGVKPVKVKQMVCEGQADGGSERRRHNRGQADGGSERRRPISNVSVLSQKPAKL